MLIQRLSPRLTELRADTKSDPEEAPSEVEELQSLGSRIPLMDEEFEAFEPIGTRTDSSYSSASSDSITPLSPDHPLTHVSPTPTPTRASFHRRKARMTVRAQLAMSPGLSASVTEAMALSDSAFSKRYRSSYETPSPYPPLLVHNRYRGTSELVLDTDSEGDELGDEDADEDGEDESLDADDERERLDDEGHGLDDEDHGLDDEGCGLEGKGLGLGEEAAPEGQQQAVSVMDIATDKPLGLGYRAARRRALESIEEIVPNTFEPTLTTWVDPEDGRVYTDILVYVPPAAPVQTPPSPEWSSGQEWLETRSSRRGTGLGDKVWIFVEARAGIGGMGRAY
ncbi:hypothetical protein Tco_1480667 [Tanacetum coccineum]